MKYFAVIMCVKYAKLLLSSPMPSQELLTKLDFKFTFIQHSFLRKLDLKILIRINIIIPYLNYYLDFPVIKPDK